MLGRRYGFDHIVFLLGHGAAAILEYFRDGAPWGVRIDAIIEERPMGSAGAVLGALNSLADRFAVMYGDTMLNIDLSRLCRAHEDSAPTLPSSCTRTTIPTTRIWLRSIPHDES